MDDYGYLNARVRAMNGDLLKREFFLELLNKPGLGNMVEALQGTTLYGEDVSVALAESSGLNAIEKSLRHNLSRTFGKILHMTSGEPRSLTCILLNKWDIFNIKTILRGKKSGRSKEEIVAAFVPVGELDEPKLAELANQPDIKTVVDMLVTWRFHLFSPLIAKALPEFTEKGDILGIERTIDDFYFEWALKETKDASENKQIMRSFIVEQIDFANIVNTLKHLNEKASVETGVKPQPQSASGGLHEAEFLPGGSFKNSFLQSLSKCATLEEALGLLVNTKFSSVMEKAISAYTKTRRLSTIERFLEAFMAEKWSCLYKKDPLSISIIIGFLGRKLNEFMNLRIIARGKAHAVPLNIIKGDLVFV
ncbi:MAG: V-type ATPase subunit [Candidatus Brocadiales bacterium]